MKNSIKIKFVLVSMLILIISSMTIGAISYRQAKASLDQKGQIILKNAVVQAEMLIESYQEAVERGEITVEEAQEAVKVHLLGPMDEEGKRPINNAFDLGESGYFAVYSTTGDEIMHPSLEGKNVWDAEDKSGSGFKLVQEIVNVATNGGGYVYYTWNLPNSEALGEKITYQEYNEEWGWVISVGAYEMDFNAEANRVLIDTLIVLFVAVVIGFIIIWVFATRMTNPIKRVTVALSEVATGNLNVNKIEISTKDETGILADSFNDMLDNLRNIIETTSNSSKAVNDSTSNLQSITTETTKSIQEVVVTIQEVANAVSDEASGAETVSEKTNELSNSIIKIQDLTSSMNEAVNVTRTECKKGMQSIAALDQSATKTEEVTKEVGTVIENVNDANRKIYAITDAITSIAEQTNLLALNASIEAARAGEAGKGFAVVADEIRKLSEESNKSVSEIKEIINEINDYSVQSAEKMKEVSVVVSNQSTLVNDTSDQFNEIITAVKALVKSIETLNSETDAINSMREGILSSVLNISASTEETSAATQQVSATTEEQLAGITEIDNQMRYLNDIASNLSEAINQFKL